MQIKVDRFTSDTESTISTVSIDGKFQCFGLEDEYRAVKVWGETRIPAGKYAIGLRTVGGFHTRYRRRFGHLHQGMLEITGVPGFTFILIHCGNKDEDTAGCLLIGEGASCRPCDMMITNSTTAYKKFYGKVIDAVKSGKVNIEFVDNDR